MRVAHLLSGGVDSSVALKLLLDLGYDVEAFFIKVWLEDELTYLGSCPWEEDLEFCRKTCELLGVPLRVVNLQKDYWEKVVSESLSEVKSGRTPNPDILCNSRVKFGAFIDSLGDELSSFDKISSGHYAQVEEKNGKTMLLRAADKTKDQTYFLARLSQEQLHRLIFPIGHLPKEEVRAIAETAGLPAAYRKDSQGICFLGKVKYDEFIEHHLGVKQGPFIDASTGSVIGTHDGHWFYTAGQRHGIPLAHGPWYVVSKDALNNSVVISNEYDDIPRDSCKLRDLQWINAAPTGFLRVKIRHGPKDYSCKYKDNGDGTASIDIDGQDQGMAPGQYVVFYEGKICLGSGIITQGS